MLKQFDENFHAFLEFYKALSFSRDKIGKEYITLYDTQQMMTSGDLFYTDANGREILERR